MNFAVVNKKKQSLMKLMCKCDNINKTDETGFSLMGLLIHRINEDLKVKKNDDQIDEMKYFDLVIEARGEDIDFCSLQIKDLTKRNKAWSIL